MPPRLRPEAQAAAATRGLGKRSRPDVLSAPPRFSTSDRAPAIHRSACNRPTHWLASRRLITFRKVAKPKTPLRVLEQLSRKLATYARRATKLAPEAGLDMREAPPATCPATIKPASA